jgi:mannose/cellobiose epimerase-like protein (N-acyl-D-glucosamine 2-epimerase family)
MPTDVWLEHESLRLLDFARGAVTEDGFGWLDADGRVDSSAAPQLWITGRMTHVFALGALLGRPGCGELADHGLRSLRTGFADADYGGWFSELPESERKEAYAHSFVLLAAASGAVARRPEAAALLDEAIAVIEQRFWSQDEGACLESWDRAWTAPEAYRGMNANMHLVEAFLAAGDATGAAVWPARALRIAERLIDRSARGAGWRVIEHFAADWTPLPDYNRDEPRHPFRPFGVTPGHALEWSRLLLSLRAALHAPPPWLLDASRQLFARAVADGWVAPGGFVYTTDYDGRPVVRERFHWPVTEAIGAAATLYAVTGEAEYAAWSDRCWAFVQEHLIDTERGSWWPELDESLTPVARTWPGKPDVYHAFQATLIPRLPPAASLAGALR